MDKDLSLTRLHKDRLLDCFEQRFCPVCRAIWQLDAKRFDWYVNDGVLDEETLRLVVQAAGQWFGGGDMGACLFPQIF
jgi:hypothetical protein